MQIIINTPLWVYFLFIALVYLAYIQTKDRYLSKKRLIIVPFIMILISIFSTFNTFEININNIFFYFLGVVLGSFFHLVFKFPIPIKENNVKYRIKGSFHSFILIMSIFFTKYFINVLEVVNPTFLINEKTIFVFCMLFGIYSGILFRGIYILVKIK